MPTPENIVVVLIITGVVLQGGIIVCQALELREWKRRAINAETEVKHMLEIYGPPKHKGL